MAITQDTAQTPDKGGSGNDSRSATPLLDSIQTPADMKGLSDADLRQLADELRAETIAAVSQTGGHLGAGLGVVELTTALHAVFDTPRDKLIWDVGHQCYPHKILTGRRGRIHTLRLGGGLSGFTKRSESEYDPFGAGHSSTSLSAALGMAEALKQKGQNSHVIAVIGDGALSAGMAYEALNNAAALTSNLIVILNDNSMSISPPVGAMTDHLAKQTKDHPETLFTAMGFAYSGPIDGHDLGALLPALRDARDVPRTQPLLIHIRTQKGKGYAPAENAGDKMHGVSKFDIVTGSQYKGKSTHPTYTQIFAQSLIQQAEQDDKIVAITAAMDTGTGLDAFARAFPDRTFDVGIAEQHAVTFAAGLAAEGLKPFCAIYSTFLQRAYDQIIHDVAIQNLPVRFAIDRAGLVGADGPTHAGAFDTAYLGCLPNMTLMAPSDEAELMHMVATAAAHNDGPIAFRYPRGAGRGATLPEHGTPLPIGKGRIVYNSSSPTSDAGAPFGDPAQVGRASDTIHDRIPAQGGHDSIKADIAILSYGARLQECKIATQMLEDSGKTITLADARFAKPLDEALIRQLATNHACLLTIEEGAIGGFGSFVLNFIHNDPALQNSNIPIIRTLHLPDSFLDHATPEAQYKVAQLSAKDIVKKAFS